MEKNLEFVGFPKMARLSREIVITEKIDGTNACIKITAEGDFLTGSRTRWITPTEDNHGFSKWAYDNEEDLLLLGEGLHFGEWWGSGIQRGYGLEKGQKRFSLFNTTRWNDTTAIPTCCHVVPELYRGEFDTSVVEEILENLKTKGSVASPNFMKPEGIILFHTAGNVGFKKTIEKDEVPKSISYE